MIHFEIQWNFCMRSTKSLIYSKRSDLCFCLNSFGSVNTMSKTIKYMRLSIIISSKYCNHLSMIKRKYVCSLVWPGLFVVDVLRSICFFLPFICIYFAFDLLQSHLEYMAAHSVFVSVSARLIEVMGCAMKLFLACLVSPHSAHGADVSFQRHIEMGLITMTQKYA